mmetsp:Transcript_20824/g.53152  ORF Transcript_20824/g.53152 Transcript_20824/m.53152 type:complete len:102 (-) Transcript_20824:168-473(-)
MDGDVPRRRGCEHVSVNAQGMGACMSESMLVASTSAAIRADACAITRAHMRTTWDSARERTVTVGGAEVAETRYIMRFFLVPPHQAGWCTQLTRTVDEECC